MGTPYQRQDVSNNIANGNIINADDLDAEFNALEAAFIAATGHSHDGTTGEGGPITVVGPVQDLIISSTQVLPKTNNTLDLGSSAFRFKDAWLAGALTANSATLTSGTVGGANIATVSSTQTLTNKTVDLTNNTLIATSAQLAAAVTDETGTGALVFAGSPALTGTPTAPTAVAGTNTTQIATTAHVFAERTNTATLTNKTLTSPTINTATIAGGTINNAVIGGTTPVAGTFTTGTFGLGAVGTPSITITGDPNTGLWSPGADTLAVSTGGVERLRFFANSLILPALTTEARQIEIGSGRAGDGNSFVDLIGDATYTDYGARFIREPGENADSRVIHRGTGALRISAQDAGTVLLMTSNADRVRVEANGIVGIGGTPNASAMLDVISTSRGFRAPSMTTTQRDAIASPVAGLLIYNTTLNFYQVYNGTAWTSVGGGATGGGTDQIFWENGQTVTTPYTITNGKNAMSAGPITINSGITVTVGDGEVWTIV